MTGLFVFVLAAWVLILLGGAVAVLVLESISISGYGTLDNTLTYIARGIVAVLLIIAWILALSKIKNMILRGAGH